MQVTYNFLTTSLITQETAVRYNEEMKLFFDMFISSCDFYFHFHSRPQVPGLNCLSKINLQMKQMQKTSAEITGELCRQARRHGRYVSAAKCSSTRPSVLTVFDTLIQTLMVQTVHFVCLVFSVSEHAVSYCCFTRVYKLMKLFSCSFRKHQQ